MKYFLLFSCEKFLSIKTSIFDHGKENLPKMETIKAATIKIKHKFRSEIDISDIISFTYKVNLKF